MKYRFVQNKMLNTQEKSLTATHNSMKRWPLKTGFTGWETQSLHLNFTVLTLESKAYCKSAKKIDAAQRE